MKEFDELVAVVDRLLGPDGCPWDQKQTMKSIRSDVLEEVCELIEAIDLDDDAHIQEELGDLFFNVVFLSRLAEKENRTKMQEALHDIAQKLIRRHPHVWGDTEINSSEELLTQWDTIKKTEKGKEARTSALDGIPKGLPALARAQKVLKKSSKKGFVQSVDEQEFKSEEELGDHLLRLVAKAEAQGFDTEHALKLSLSKFEKNFREFEAGQKPSILL